MKKNLAYAFLILLISILAQSISGQRVMTPADTLRIANVGDAQISPDGEWVVYTVSATERNATSTTLWLAHLVNPVTLQDRGQALPFAPIALELLLPGGMNGATPRWSPDGKRIA
ncbi:MAG TPA: hypothetical protein VF766_08250, partial [Pyrinomonadaceae bacterium]